MNPVYQEGTGWAHVLDPDTVFPTESEAWADYRRCLAKRKSCSTGGCDD